MKKILVLEDREEFLSNIERWLDLNFPSLDSYEVNWVTDITTVPSQQVGSYDIIIFTGTVGGVDLYQTLHLTKSWKNRLFIYQDERVSTRQLLLKLKRAGIQTMKMVIYG